MPRIRWTDFGEPCVLAVTGLAGLAAAAPVILHGHAAPDCNPQIALCAGSDAMYLPDDPAPEPVPQLILSPPVAGSTVAMPSSAVMRYPIT
jgi:hypothetical protein